MGFGWSSKHVSPIGVDFGTDSVKLLQIVDEDTPQLVAAASATIPPEVRAYPEAYRQWLAGALRDLLREGKFKGKRAVAALSAGHTYVQHVRLAKAEGVDLDSQIDAELRGRLPLDPAGLVIRHVAVGDVFADGSAKQEVICLAASREAVFRQVNTMRTAGLDIRGIHCEPMAMLAAFGHLFRRGDDHERTTLFVDLGATTTKAIIAHGKQLVFAKTIQVAGEHFTRHLADRLGIDPAEARLRRIQQAEDSQDRSQPAAPTPTVPSRRRVESPVPALQAAGGASPMPTPAPSAHAGVASGDAIDDLMETVIDELRLCVGYHASMFDGRAIEKIVFLGGESRQIGLCQRVAQALRLPAQLGDPLARLVRLPGSTAPVGVDLRKPQPGWAVPLGLCLLPTNL